jgi:hypothetical protein
MFSSGVAKLLSGDPTWRNLTALNYHYETQPLPTPLGWFFYQIPGGFQKFSVLVMFFVELVIPFFIFAPRRLRFFAGGAIIFLQIMIALPGNYAFFNLISVALCLLLFDDEFLVRLVPRWLRDKITFSLARVSRGRLRQVLAGSFAALVVLGGVAEIPGVRVGRWLPSPAALILNRMRSLRIVSGYGLFAVMTTSRPEIVIEGSRDGETWSAYEFKYKPGDVNRAPPWVAPHQPRLDWQMWFAALGSYRENPWFGNLMLRLLQGSPEVLDLLRQNPFADAPPRYVRALLYDYHFTDFSTKRTTGAWWRRKLVGAYFPAVSLPVEGRVETPRQSLSGRQGSSAKGSTSGGWARKVSRAISETARPRMLSRMGSSVITNGKSSLGMAGS